MSSQLSIQRCTGPLIVCGVCLGCHGQLGKTPGGKRQACFFFFLRRSSALVASMLNLHCSWRGGATARHDVEAPHKHSKVCTVLWMHGVIGAGQFWQLAAGDSDFREAAPSTFGQGAGFVCLLGSVHAGLFRRDANPTWGPKTLFFLGQKALPAKSGHTAKYVFLRFLFNILSTKYGFYTVKYGQLWQMTEKNNLSGKNMPNMPFDRKKVAFRGSRNQLVLHQDPLELMPYGQWAKAILQPKKRLFH